MAEVDFGDSELFQQLDDSAPPVPTHIRFTDDEEAQEDMSLLRSRLEESDDYIQRLTDENKGLRRKLSILTRPSGITIDDVSNDGPLLQILYINNDISKQCRQEIEDCVCSVILRHQTPDGQKKKSSFHLKAQNSAFALDEDPQKSNATSIKTTTEAFKVVGSVLYFTAFRVDKLGQPLLNENPQMTEGWEVPTYQQVFNQVIGTDGQEIEMKDKRPKSMCFNCGSATHQLRDCPKPKDMAAINERRKEFTQNSNQGIQSNRYHAEEVEERFAKYKPGIMSEELLAALGVDGTTLPPLIYRMRQLGYPPGWLKEAEMENSGLTLYDGNAPNDGSDDTSTQKVSYDLSKLIDFPGFNVPAPYKMKDEFMQYGSVPMQSSHMKQNYAAYLSNNFNTSGGTCNKRQHESNSSPQQRKKMKGSPDRTSDRSSDMDIESDPGTPYSTQSTGDFRFQPPLPPGSGSPCFSSPPPLPQGTPPATPTPPPLPKGTPPSTPTNGSPAVRKQILGDETMEGTEDDLTLEELEEQQRQLWAALENADTATNSDCETPAMGTPVPSSSSVSTPAHVDTETEEVEEVMETALPTETKPPTSENESKPGVQERCPSPLPVKSQEEIPGPVKIKEDHSQIPGPVKIKEDHSQIPGPVKIKEDHSQIPGPVKLEEHRPQSPGPVKVEEDSPQSPDPDAGGAGEGDGLSEKIAAVPHRRNFAAGIVPFEDTPEYTEVAEATGTYLRIRDLLKSSPRNLARKKPEFT